MRSAPGNVTRHLSHKDLRIFRRSKIKKSRFGLGKRRATYAAGNSENGSVDLVGRKSDEFDKYVIHKGEGNDRIRTSFDNRVLALNRFSRKAAWLTGEVGVGGPKAAKVF